MSEHLHISRLLCGRNRPEAAGWRAAGKWQDLTLADRARKLAASAPDQVTHVDGNVSLTAGQAWDRSGRLASALWSRGYRAGEVVAFITPNWHEAVIINLAACRLGLIVCPIVPIYRDRDVQLILKDSRAKGIFVAHRFRGFDYLQMLAGLAPVLPLLQDVFTVRGDMPAPGASADMAQLLEEPPGLTEFPPVPPDSVKLVLYTSGTTGRPKAVLHSHNTLCRSSLVCAPHWGIRRNDTTLMPSPVTHITGYSNGLEGPFTSGTRCVLMDRWDAAKAADLIEKEEISFTLCATPFLQELLDLAEKQGRRLPSLRCFPCGGASIPPELIYRVRRVLENCRSFRMYGSSEAPAITAGYSGHDQLQLAAETDGEVIDYQVRIVDPNNRPVPAGVEGEICAKGPSLFLGYADDEDNERAFDSEGFFHTGDVGIRTAAGAIVFTGRIKDLINRGGEKISAKEVEDLLHTQPGVQQAAVISMPHARLGETVCAYIVLKPGAQFSCESALAQLEAARVARQKHPERFVIVDQMPATASGKVKKDLLRLDLRERMAGERAASALTAAGS